MDLDMEFESRGRMEEEEAREQENMEDTTFQAPGIVRSIPLSSPDGFRPGQTYRADGARRTTGFQDYQTRLEKINVRGSRYGPFRSRMEAELALWIKTYNLTRRGLDELLRIQKVNYPQNHDCQETF